MSSPNTFTLTTEAALMATGAAAIRLKISAPTVEVNVYLPQAQAGALATVADRAPTQRALRLGVAAGAAAHWARDEEDRYYLLIGEDAETWDVALTFDRATFFAICAAVTPGVLARE